VVHVPPRTPPLAPPEPEGSLWCRLDAGPHDAVIGPYTTTTEFPEEPFLTATDTVYAQSAGNPLVSTVAHTGFTRADSQTAKRDRGRDASRPRSPRSRTRIPPDGPRAGRRSR
jgi:hypothetical protein